jgi:NADPH:quinone reductase-like Zn-dependent oxidoreductase
MFGHITDQSAPGGLARREIPEPVPSSHEAVVGVRAYAINRGELYLLPQRPDGWTPGQDVAGVVVTPAADGSGPSAGTRVVGLADGGGWSERVAVPTHRMAPLPDNVSFADAAALPVAGLTALRTLRTGGPLLGRRVLVTGASGGVGHFAVQLAKLAGARVTGLVSGPHRVETLQSLGIEDVVTAGQLDDRTGPFDVAVDGVGGQVLVDVIHHAAPGGTVTAYGLASGEPSTLTFADFVQAPFARLIGFFIYRSGEETFGEDLGFLAGLVGDGRLRVETGVRWDWSRTVEAVDALRQRKVTGRAVLLIGED